MNKFYGAHDQWTDLDKQNDVLITSTDGVIDSVKVNGEDYGGGGSSDFSTAEVTIVGGEIGLTLSGGIQNESEGYIFLNSTEYGDIGVTTIAVSAETTITTKAVLFKNLMEDFPHDFIAMFGAADGFAIASVEGDCELGPSGDVGIWGDCTITGGRPK